VATHCIKITSLVLLACGLCAGQPPLYLKTRRAAEARPEIDRGMIFPSRLGYRRSHLLVQFREAPRPEALEELARRGARLLEYVPRYGFMISADDSTTLEGLDLARAEWLRPEDKLSPLLTRKVAAESEEVAAPDTFVVEFHRDVENYEAREVIRRNGLATREHPDLLPNQLLVDGTVEDAARLAQWDEVEYVFPASKELKAGERVYVCAGAATVYGLSGQITALYGDGWDGPGKGSAQLGYFLGGLASALPRAAVQTEILRAWAGWSKYVAVTFAPVSDANQARTIGVLFARGAHGDGYPFDGPGGVLAHTFYPSPPNPEPIAGDMHFDDSENWGIGQGVDVFSVALHESGHALGLGHSDQPTSVMYPYYKLYTGLTADDIAAIRMLYAPAGTPPTTPPATPPTTPTAPKVAITSPTTGSSYTSTTASVTLAGTAQHPDGIRQVTWVNARGGSGVASGTLAWVAGPVALQSGQNPITVTATALSGGTASQSLTVTYSAPSTTKDTVAPTLTILSPPGTSVSTSASSATLSGTASDNVGVVEVTWADSIGNGGAAQGTARWTAGPIALRVGTNAITIRARDAAGNVGWRSVVFTRR
jgi:hypothetical protein